MIKSGVTINCSFFSFKVRRSRNAFYCRYFKLDFYENETRRRKLKRHEKQFFAQKGSILLAAVDLQKNFHSMAKDGK